MCSLLQRERFPVCFVNWLLSYVNLLKSYLFICLLLCVYRLVSCMHVDVTEQPEEVGWIHRMDPRD